jgi:hypothetical protein
VIPVKASQLAGSQPCARREVARLKLNADWVVLSACNTEPPTSQAWKRCRGWRAPSSMRGRLWCRTARSIHRPPPGSPLDVRHHEG